MAARNDQAPGIGLAASTYLGQALTAAAAGDQVRTAEALTAISDPDWAAIKTRFTDPLAVGILTAAQRPAADDFESAVQQALTVVSGTTWIPDATGRWSA